METYIYNRINELEKEIVEYIKAEEEGDFVNIFAKRSRERCELVIKELRLVLAFNVFN